MKNLSNLESDFLGSKQKVLLATSVLAFKILFWLKFFKLPIC